MPTFGDAVQSAPHRAKGVNSGDVECEVCREPLRRVVRGGQPANSREAATHALVPPTPTGKAATLQLRSTLVAAFAFLGRESRVPDTR